MTYNEILKQRRLALQLSIQDISSQTQLEASLIQAVEQHQLEAFHEDYSYIRYFIQTYCDLIGVNWPAISDEVEMDINNYAKQLEMMRKPAEPEKKPEAPTKKKRTNRRAKQKRSKQLSKNKWVRWVQKMNRSKYAHVYRLIVIGLVVVLFLSLVNAVLSYRSNQRLAAEEEQRQTQIAQKEKETQQLANQKQNTDSDSSKNTTLTATDKANNVYEVSGVVGNSNEITLTITLPEDSTVAVYKDDELITDSADEVYSGTFTKTIEVDQACMIQVEIGTYSTNKIRLNGKSVSFSKSNWTEGSPAVLYFDVLGKDGESAQDSSSDTTSDTSTNTAVVYDQSY